VRGLLLASLRDLGLRGGQGVGSSAGKVDIMLDEQDEKDQIHALFDAGDRALMAADVDALAEIFADDYVQYDPSGQPFTKEQVLENLRTSAVRYPSIVSTGRDIRLLGNFAIVHGSEDDIVEADGQRFPARYLYMDVVVKRNGRWQIVGSLLAKPEEICATEKSRSFATLRMTKTIKGPP
jgi:uncharacterized protein (TIGR02246 family)